MYKKLKDGAFVRLADGAVVAFDEPGFVEYRRQGGAYFMEASPLDAALGLTPLELGQALDDALGEHMEPVGAKPSEALKAHRHFKELRDALRAGQLEIAAGAIDEMLEAPGKRPGAVSDEQLREARAQLMEFKR